PQHPVEHTLVELYDECRRDLAAQPVGGQVLDELAECQPPRVVPVCAGGRVTPRRSAALISGVALRRRHRTQHLPPPPGEAVTQQPATAPRRADDALPA